MELANSYAADRGSYNHTHVRNLCSLAKKVHQELKELFEELSKRKITKISPWTVEVLGKTPSEKWRNSGGILENGFEANILWWRESF